LVQILVSDEAADAGLDSSIGHSEGTTKADPQRQDDQEVLRLLAG
jgi:hypothetical protein